jgi:hypothetical protein
VEELKFFQEGFRIGSFQLLDSNDKTGANPSIKEMYFLLSIQDNETFHTRRSMGDYHLVVHVNIWFQI